MAGPQGEPTPRSPEPEHVPDVRAAELARQVAQIGEGRARAAVLGINDGLVTNLSLLIGVAGARASAHSIRIAGLASLIAGAFSMATGEWVSVRAQVDLYRGLLLKFRRHYVTSRPAVTHALMHRLKAQGIDNDTASTAVSQIIGSDERGVAVATRLLLGLDPSELGSPWAVATASLMFFAIGALVPLAPWLVSEGGVASVLSILFTAIGGAIAGAVIASISEEKRWRGAVRQVLIVAAAAGLTFGIGRLVGTAVS